MILTALSDKSGGGQETVRTRLVGRHNSWFVPGLYVTELRRTWSMGLLFAIVLAACVGCLLPMGAKRLGLDPAVMASPMITTIVDAAALLLYFMIATVMLGL